MWVPAVSGSGENCPGSIAAYEDSFLTLGPNHKNFQVIASKVRKHLVFIGWKVDRWGGGMTNRMRYTSPSGEVSFSLREICSQLVVAGDDIDTDDSRCRSSESSSDAVENEESEEQVSSKCWEEFHEESSEKIAQKYVSNEIQVKTRQQRTLQVRNSLSAAGWKFVDKLKKSKLRTEKVYISPNGRKFYSLRSACDWWCKNSGSLCNNNKREEAQQIHEDEEVESEDESDGRREKKRRRRDIGARNNNQKSMLSRLIDSGSLLIGEKVQYRSKNEGPPLKEGQICREGIKCLCCSHVFNVSKFETHAGSKRHRPCESLFLEDGRSLMDCRKNQNPTGENKKHDFVCSVCREGGKLLMCELCPSVYHSTCLGIKEISGASWYCPSCCCGFCGNRYEDGVEQSMLSIDCFQCQLKCKLNT